MASILYKDGSTFSKSTDAAFDTIHTPGNTAPHPGLYQCVGCKHIIAIAGGNTFPPQNHHTHTTSQGTVRWQLVVSHTSN